MTNNANIIATTLDILRDTADDIEREGDIDTTTTRLVIWAAARTLEDEIKRLQEESNRLHISATHWKSEARRYQRLYDAASACNS